MKQSNEGGKNYTIDHIPEADSIIIQINQLSQEASKILQSRGIPVNSNEMRDKIVYSLWSVIKNPTIRHDSRVLQTLQDNIYAFMNRLTYIDWAILMAYEKRRGWLEDLNFSHELDQIKNDSARKVFIFNDLFDRGLSATLIPQAWLLERAYERRALSYDYNDWRGLQKWLTWIDSQMMGKWSILDFVLDRSQKQSIAYDQNLWRDGANYIIDTLKPRWSAWLRQMVQNGNITEHSSTIGYTDVMINGARIDIVNLLLLFRSELRSFQNKEREIDAIRKIATSKKEVSKGSVNTLPSESKNFTDIAHEKISEEWFMRLFEESKSWEDGLKVFARFSIDSLSLDIWMNFVSGIDGNGVVMTGEERSLDILVKLPKSILMTMIMGKICVKVIMGIWKPSQKWLAVIYQMAKEFLWINHLMTRKLWSFV